MKSTLSVTLAAYNEANKITKCLQAIDDIADEIIVVDGGSTDKSVEIAQFNNVRVLHNPDRGYGANLHYGIMHCGADIVWYFFYG